MGIETDTLCFAVTVWEKGQVTHSSYLEETSPAWETSEIRVVINELIAPAVHTAGRSTE
jgi:hypothetical protein